MSSCFLAQSNKHSKRVAVGKFCGESSGVGLVLGGAGGMGKS